MASVSDIAPLSSTAQTGGKDVETEITKLADTIIKSSTEGLKGAAQAVVGNVPEMIADLTNEIKSGPIDTFAIAMNKLVSLVDKLGINLRQYNEDLADTVDEYRGSQEKLQQKLHELREQGIHAEINSRGDGIRHLTALEVKKYEAERKQSEKLIETNKLEIKERIETINNLEAEGNLTKAKRETLQKEIDSRDKANEGLQKEVDIVDGKIGKKADTGSGRFEDQGFGKMAELKEAFMVVPDTIAEVFGGFKNVGKIISTSLVGFFKHPMKAISRVFGAIANIFKIARVMIALKVLAVIAALQFVAERIDMIGDVFRKIWGKITDFFKGIIDWFKNYITGGKILKSAININISYNDLINNKYKPYEMLLDRYGSKYDWFKKK